MCNMEWAGQESEKVPCQCTRIISRDKGKKSTLHAPHHLILPLPSQPGHLHPSPGTPGRESSAVN